MTEIVLPSEDRFDLPLDVQSVDELKKLIQAQFGIPVINQILFNGSKVIKTKADLTKSKRLQEIELRVVVGDKYLIGRAGVEEESDFDQIFVPTRSIVKNRKIEDFGRRPRILVKDPGQKDDGAERAAPFFDTFNSGRKWRLGQLGRIRAQLDDGPVVLCMFNWGYHQLLQNWAESCDRHGISCRNFTLLFPTDEDSDAMARSMGFRTYFDPSYFGPLPKNASGAFGDGDFRKVIFGKIAMVQDMLELGGDYIRQDVDLVWFKDPREQILKQADAELADMLFMYDGPNYWHQPLHMNSGFIYLKDNKFTKHAWNLVFSNYGQVLVAGAEQRLINLVMLYLRERGLRCDIMPEKLFTNGHRFTQENELPSESLVAHASWTSNLEAKIEMMKRVGIWYL